MYELFVAPGGGLRPLLWLISNIRVYLTGFSKCRNRPKVRKDSQKYGGEKHELHAFTLIVFIIVSAYMKRTIY